MTPSSFALNQRFVVRELGPRCFVVDDTATGLSYDPHFTRKAAQEAANRRNAQTPCSCGEPMASGTRHRTDGPCYLVTPPMRVIALAIARTEAWRWADGEALEGKPLWQMYLAQAEAVLAALPEAVGPSDHYGL